MSRALSFGNQEDPAAPAAMRYESTLSDVVVMEGPLLKQSDWKKTMNERYFILRRKDGSTLQCAPYVLEYARPEAPGA